MKKSLERLLNTKKEMDAAAAALKEAQNRMSEAHLNYAFALAHIDDDDWEKRQEEAKAKFEQWKKENYTPPKRLMGR